MRRSQQDPANVVLVEVISPGVTIPVGVGITDQCLPGYVKAALHFVAGFVDAPHAATIAALRPYIFGGRAVPVVPLPFREPFFDSKGPVRHEVTIYPDGKNAVVTIMLFSAIVVAIELPHFGTRRSLRHRQLLGGCSGPELIDVEPYPVPRRRLSDREWDHLLETTRAALIRIFATRHHSDIDEMAQQAARTAWGRAATSNLANFTPYFQAELETLALPRRQISALVRESRAHLTAGRLPFDPSTMLL